MNKNILGAALMAAALFCGGNVYAQRSINNPMTQAILSVYADELRENPRDYDVLLSRADEYNRHGEYMLALTDVDNALEFIPSSATETILRAKVLRAGINRSMNNNEQALSDLEAAALLSPESVGITLLKATVEFDLGRYGDAKADYQRLLRLNSHSQDAYLGLAAVAVKELNLGTANDMLERAVAIDPNSSEVYIRRAEVRSMMGNHNGAVDDLVLALSIDPENSRALNKLVDYASTNYAAAMAGMSSAVSAAPTNGMYRYLRAGIAQAHAHYLAAIDDYTTIVNERLYDYPGLQASMAECDFALGNYEKALNNIEYAISRDPNKVNYYILRSKILRALGRNEEAVRAGAAAIACDRESAEALAEMAMGYMATGNYEQANSLLGEAMLTDAENPNYPLLRGWIAENYTNNPTAANQYYNMVTEMDHFYVDNPRSLKGFALVKLGQNDQAKRWMDNILATVNDNDGSINYYAACLYNMLGDEEKALQCANAAMDAGYANYHEWINNTDGPVTPGTLRDDLRFLNTVSRHNAIFGR